MTFKAGADAGNNGLKLWVKDMEPIMIQTVYSLYMGETTALMEMEDIPLEELEKNIDITISSPGLLMNGSRYVIGDKVLNDRLVPVEMEKKSDKSKDEMPLILTLAGLTIQAMRLNPEQDRIQANFDLAVALPIGTITPENASKNAARYMGSHKVTFHHPSGRNVEVELTIEYCKCLPEGAAATWGIVFDENGHVAERKAEIAGTIQKIHFVDRTLLSFDIGAGTTEIVVTKGVRFNPKLSEGLGYGVKLTILEIIKRWNRQYPMKSIDSIAEFNEIYFDSEHPRHNTLVDYSKTGLQQLALQMSQAIINKIDDLKDNPYVFIYGGGADVIKDYLLDILKKKDRMTNVMFMNQAMYVNAKGLLVYTCSPRYEEQKTKDLTAA